MAYEIFEMFRKSIKGSTHLVAASSGLHLIGSKVLNTILFQRVHSQSLHSAVSRRFCLVGSQLTIRL